MEGHHITREALEHRFAHHPPTSQEVIDKHTRVRTILLNAADDLVQVTGPPTPEQTLMVRKLEEAMFWGNATIARNLNANDDPL
jgi:hypothetical protein